MKRMFALLLAVLMVLSMAACSEEKKEETKSTEGTQAATQGQAAATEQTGAEEQTAQKYTIGICQFLPHPALDQATEGFKAAVIDNLGAENVTFDEQDAAGEASNCSTIVTGMVASKVDLIMANATPAVAAAANATTKIPVLGTSVTEYGVALGLDDFDGVVGFNVSGTSDLADLEEQAKMITDWCPDAEYVGLLYCSAEANSKYQVDKVQEYLEAAGLICEQFAFTDTSDLMVVVEDAADFSDVVYIPTDNTAANNATAIDNVLRPAKIPVIAGEAGLAKACGIATLSIDYYDLGYATGLMAVRILKDGEDITKMPIEYAPEVSYLYNEEICTELGITPLEGYEKLETE